MFYFLSCFFMFSYVSGNNSFPEPLKPKEEERLLNAFANGDMEARDKLIEHNLRLVAHIAKKYTMTNKDLAGDYISIGTIGLIKGVNTYKSDKKTKLATYAAKCIENEILMSIRASKKGGNDLSLQDIIGTDAEGNEVKIEDKISIEDYSVEDEVVLEMETEVLKRAVAGNILNERERIVIVWRYGLDGNDELTQREIADRLDISRSYVSRIEKKALSKLNQIIKA